MNKVAQFLIAIVVVGAGVGIAAVLVATAPETKKAPASIEATLVNVIRAEAVDQAVEIAGQGTIVAARSVQLKSEVPGRIVWVSPNLVTGGRVKASELLFKIEDRDYELEVDQRRADVQRAQFELAEEQGRRRVAEKEWKLLGTDAPSTAEGKALALREPQLKAKLAALASAKSGLAMARLKVERTRTVAPFNAFVRREDVDVGQLVERQTDLGALIGTDEFWVEVNVPVADLEWVIKPDAEGEDGAKARVQQALKDGKRIEREGRVIRLAGELDPRGRMARLIVSVKDPMDPPPGQLPLLLGAYVEVMISGATLEQVVVLPRRALRPSDQLWIMNETDQLEIRTAKVAYRGRDRVYVSEGVAPGERVVLSRLATPVAKMPLRTPDGATPEINAAADRPLVTE